MATIINDGSVVAGIAEDFTINGQTYTIIDISMTTGSSKVLRSDRQNKPSGRKVVQGETTGTMTLQLSGPSQPTFTIWGAQITSSVYGNIYISSVGESQTQGGQTTVPCGIDQAISTVTVT